MVFVGATANGKIMGARIAAELKAGCVTDVIAIKEADGKVVLSSPMYSGTVIAESVIEGTAVAIVRGGVFKKLNRLKKLVMLSLKLLKFQRQKQKLWILFRKFPKALTLKKRMLSLLADVVWAA